MRTLMRTALRFNGAALMALASAALAQQTVAPTPLAVGRARGEDIGSYNVTNSFELGYRFHSVGGNTGKYRSDVNYGNGLRLLGSNLTVNSKEGQGRLFDEIVLTTQGLGNDPYQFANLRVQHNRWYRYDMLWRINDYYNPALTISGGRHFQDTRRQWQDHDVTFLPQSRFRLLAGYSRNTQTGPALTTGQFFDSRGDEFVLFSDVSRRQREYRVGGDVSVAGVRFIVVRAWQRFEEDTPIALDTPSGGANPADLTALTRLKRSEPYSGDTPFWRLHLLSERASVFSINGRFSYAGSRRNFLFDEMALGTDRLGAARNRQVLVSGSGRRPFSSGTLTLTLAPSERFVLGNHTAFHQVQMDGDSVYREVNNATQSSELLRFQFLGIRTIVNNTDLNVRPTRQLGLFGGYRFSDRRIRSTTGFSSGNFSGSERHEQDNRLHSGVAGIRLQPVKLLTLTFDGEIGRAGRPFYPISERNYHALGARVEIRSKTLQLSAGARNFYNTNSVSLFSHSARSRVYRADASWSPRRWFGLNAGYSKQHLDTLTGIVYFAAFQPVEGQNSLYISNIHAGNAGVRFHIKDRIDWFAGYSIIQDAGDGRASAVPPAPGGRPGEPLPIFAAAQTFPLRYQSPLARLSIRLHNKLRWNFGYQYYGYREDFFTAQNYRAHTGYTSLLWSF